MTNTTKTGLTRTTKLASRFSSSNRRRYGVRRSSRDIYLALAGQENNPDFLEYLSVQDEGKKTKNWVQVREQIGVWIVSDAKEYKPVSDLIEDGHQPQQPEYDAWIERKKADKEKHSQGKGDGKEDTAQPPGTISQTTDLTGQIHASTPKDAKEMIGRYHKR